jgi:signal transduction histidine kinase
MARPETSAIAGRLQVRTVPRAVPVSPPAVARLRLAARRGSVARVTPRATVRRIEPWMLVSAAWIIPAVLGAVDNLGQQRVWGNGKAGVDWHSVLFSSLDWLLYGAFVPLIFRIARRWPIARPNVRRHVILHVLASLVFCVAWASAGTIIKLLLQPNSFDAGIAKFYASWVLTTLPFGASVYLAVVGIEHAIRYFVEARERDAQVARLSEQLSSAKLSALQAQLNPHFLFNSLNTIAVLVRDGDTPRATRVIEQLSDVLRSTLGRSRENEVTLDDELELVRQYLAVEQARFSDRLRPEFDVSPALLSAAVPSFAIQHLVENAVRHGIAKRSDAGRVIVRAYREGDSLVVIVEDDGAGIEPSAEVPGHGLDNTRERLRSLFGDRASLTVTRVEQGTVARLVIPYHEMVLEEAPRADA